MDPTNPNNVPSLPPGTLPSEPMAAPPASPKAAEDELDVALNGQEPTVKNLILAAIGVMKNRKARPDSKRISNWINRRYGRSLNEVEEELERLVRVGELARVDYKGSASFRIVQPEAKAKRRRRCPKPNAMASVPNLASSSSSTGNPRPPISITAAGSGIFAPIPTPGADGIIPPLTLRTLVIEMLGDSASASIESGVTFNTSFIAKAVEASQRQIYRAAIISNLELILTKEVEVGNFIKVGEDQYRISPYASPFNQHHSLLALNPPLAHPPPAPVPVQQLMLESRASMDNSPPKVMPPPMAPGTAASGPPPLAATPPPASPMSASSSSPPNSYLPSDEQRKNDLIAAKLSKLEGKSKSPNKKMVAVNKQKEIKKEPTAPDDEDLPLTVARSNSLSNTSDSGFLTPPPPASPGQANHENKLKMAKFRKADNEPTARGSSRKKKSRKIFDPADHDQPVRKRKATSPLPHPSEAVVANSVLNQQPAPKPREGGCIYCGLSTAKTKKGGRLEPLLRCKDCPTTVHPSCMDYSEKLIKKILQAPTWQCINCRPCYECQENNENEVMMIICDGCDQAYHLTCHRPSLTERPSGRWECCHCKPPEPRVRAKEREEENATFLPMLPAHLHPRSGMLPENWEDYDIDPEVPDVSEWEPVQLRDFFSQKGFSDALSAIFLEQEIDGRSLLLMHRNDVVSSLGLKLGPALKLFNCIKKLQTRRNFPDNY